MWTDSGPDRSGENEKYEPEGPIDVKDNSLQDSARQREEMDQKREFLLPSAWAGFLHLPRPQPREAQTVVLT